MAIEFKKAERKKSKLRLGLTGPSGSGKTYSALVIARNLGKKIAFIDTENGSAQLYSHLCEFDVLELSAPYRPEKFVEAIEAAESQGYEVIVIDSITHEWSGAGGCLEINDTLANSKYRGNTWSAWNETTPRHRKLLDKIIASPAHIITTLRAKTETVQGEGKKVHKLGMKSEQRDGFEYELTLVFDIAHESHIAMASKDRTGIFEGKDSEKITDATAKTILAWLNSGAEMKPNTSPPPEDAQPPQQKTETKKTEQKAEQKKQPAKTPFDSAAEAVVNAKTNEDLMGLVTKITDSTKLTDDEKMQLMKMAETKQQEENWT